MVNFSEIILKRLCDCEIHSMEINGQATNAIPSGMTGYLDLHSLWANLHH